MSDRLIPGADAKARIQKLSRKELQAFFDQVPAAAMRFVASVLPAVDGFRPGSPAGIIRQKETLARRLSRPNATDRDFHGLYVVWRTWIRETQPNAPLIQELIDKLEDAAHDAEDANERRLVIERHVDALLEHLTEESKQNRCTRESIEQLFTFSPFPETVASRGIVADAKSAVDVERDAAFHNLPNRLEQDEHKIHSLRSDLSALTDRVESVADETTKALGELSKMHSVIEQMRDRTIASGEFNKKQAVFQVRLDRLVEETEVLRTALRGMASQLEQVGELAGAIGSLGSAQKLVGDDCQQNALRTEALAAALDQIKRDVDALLEDRTQADRLGPLAEQIAGLKERLDVVASRPALVDEAEIPLRQRELDALVSAPRLRCTVLAAPEQGAALTSYTALATAFSRVLQSLGLRKSMAQVFAEECAAAVAARQAVFLQGAFAARLARLLARVVGGPATLRLAIPLGVQDGDEVRRAIEYYRGANVGGVSALAIEGVNHTAFDLTKDVILDCLEPSIAPDSAQGRMAIFAAISRGVASLPVEPEYTELGPVFDLDYLDWRTSVPAVAKLDESFLPAEIDLAIYAQIGKVSADVEEATRLARALVKKRNPSLERAVVRAYRALHLLRSDVKAVTPLQSLFFGWFMPYWSALNLNKEEVDSELDGGKVHGGPTDDRLSAMLEVEFPSNGPVETKP